MESVPLSDQFEELYEQYFDAVYRFIARRIASVEDVQDLVSETFLKIYEHLPSFHARHQGAQQAWIYTIARNEIYQFFRKHKHAISASLDNIPEVPSTESIPELLHQEQLSDRVRSLLTYLPQEDREIITMKYFDELANTTIAELLHLTANHVGVRLHRSLQKFKKILTDHHILS